MAEGRRGLGRGLSALLEEASADVGEANAAADGPRETPIELIRRNPDQPRRTFDETEIEELAASIREKGVLQPILVRPIASAPGEFQIIAGERRWRASQRAGLRTMPVIVRDGDDLQSLEIAIVENVQRADLNPIEEAHGYQALIERFGRIQESVAGTVGKSRSHVANALRLLQLPEEVREHVSAGRLTAGHARALVGARDPAEMARRVISSGLNVRQTEALARRASPRLETKSAKPVRNRGKDPDTRALEEDLADVLGLTVRIEDRNGAGELRISYQSLEQLDDVCRRLTQTAPGT